MGIRVTYNLKYTNQSKLTLNYIACDYIQINQVEGSKSDKKTVAEFLPNNNNNNESLKKNILI